MSTFEKQAEPIPAVDDEPLLEKGPSGSYGEILRATSIVGGSQAVTYVIGMVRTKVVALLLGPSGVGMIGLFQSSTTLVAQITGFGIGNSGVRQIAEAHGSGDVERTGRTLKVLRRVCWATGFLGWIVTAALARPLSIWAFDTPENAWLISILGVTLLFTAISGGQRALVQGTRRIGDIARMTILSSLAGTLVAAALYYFFQEHGIVPVLVVSAMINLAISWWYSRKLKVPESGKLTWLETYREGKQLTNLGFAFMWGGLLAALVDLGIRSVIVRNAGLEGTGIYQAAWGLSGLFANFILTAMGTDFYPRLTAAANDNKTMNSMVNEQIEIGILIALPGLLGTLAAGPLLMTVFYSAAFVPGAELLPWFVLGIFCRVVSWPVGFVFLAKSASKWFIVAQTQFYAIQMLAVWLLIGPLGLRGVGVAFFVAFIPGILLNLFVANRLSGFAWNSQVARQILLGAFIVSLGFASSAFLPVLWNLAIGSIFMVATGVTSVRGIVKRVGPRHRISRTLNRIPGMGFVLANLE